jgi:hypothetical protein
MTTEELDTLRYYAARALRGGPWVIMPLESAHLLQRLAGEPESRHEFNACRVDQGRVADWIKAIAIRHPELASRCGL